MNLNRKQNNKAVHTRYLRYRGFTLVEMMVAIAVFSIVMVTAMSALLTVVDANNKARAIKTAINNVSMAIESISKDMRMGTDYGCADSESGSFAECSTGNSVIRYKSPRAFFDISSGERKFAYYKFKTGQIWSCLEKTADMDCSQSSNFLPITSSEVTIKNAVFYVIGTNPLDGLQPRMIMTVSGEAGNKEKIKTEFDLQTSVSQRIRSGQLP